MIAHKFRLILYVTFSAVLQASCLAMDRQLSVTIQMPSVVSRGAPVPVTVRITNNSVTNRYALWPVIRRFGLDTVRFSIRTPDGTQFDQLRPDIYIGGMKTMPPSALPVLKLVPQGSADYMFSLVYDFPTVQERRFLFTTPGLYSIRVLVYETVAVPDDAGTIPYDAPRTKILSDWYQVRIVPSSSSYDQEAWEASQKLPDEYLLYEPLMVPADWPPLNARRFFDYFQSYRKTTLGYRAALVLGVAAAKGVTGEVPTTVVDALDDLERDSRSSLHDTAVVVKRQLQQSKSIYGQDAGLVTQICCHADMVIQMLEGDIAFDELRARSLLALLRSSVVSRSQRTVGTGHDVAQSILGMERYRKLEKACICGIDVDACRRLYAYDMLAQGCSSDVGLQVMKKRLQGLLTLYGSYDSCTTTVLRAEVFSLAENLLLSGDRVGVAIMKDAVASSVQCPTQLKVRALNALRGTDFSPSQVAPALLDDSDPDVARAAFKLETHETFFTNRHAIAAALKQMISLKEDYAIHRTLSAQKKCLLLQLSVNFPSALPYWNSLVTAQERQTIRDLVIFFANSPDETIVECVVGGLLCVVVQDTDTALLGRLLKCSSPEIESSSALAVARCSRTVIWAHRQRLLVLLDDRDMWVRSFSLYALRCGLGERSANCFSDDEFKRLKAHVVAAYANQSTVK